MYSAIGIFSNTERKPQLTEEQRKKIKVNQDEWPELWKNYDTENPYKNAPYWIPHMSGYDYFLWGFEFAFVCGVIESVFHSQAAI